MAKTQIFMVAFMVFLIFGISSYKTYAALDVDNERNNLTCGIYMYTGENVAKALYIKDIIITVDE